MVDKANKNKNTSEKNVSEELKDSVIISKSKVVLIKKLLANIKENSEQLTQLLSVFVSEEEEGQIKIGQASDDSFHNSEPNVVGGKIIEGVFDGEGMIGPDGKQYSVPANYASKSKMVEGDILKLTITDKGTFIYKQINPIERKRVVCKLEKGSDGHFYGENEGKKWKLITASVTYFKGEVGDEVVVLIPKAGDSKWGAVENIVKSNI